MGRLSSWVGEDCCQWRGVECNNISSHVTKLDLRNPYIDGLYVTTYYNHSGLGDEINSSLIHLKFLNYLDLSFNNFQGIQIPEIPPHLGNLSSLMHLDLRVNYNTNTYAKNLDWVSSLYSLKYLNMGGVNLSSVGADWLLEVNMVPSLLELHSQSCNLESLPPSLPFLNFSSLFLQGSISYDFVNLRNLEVLYLQGSRYTYNTSQLARFFGNLCKLKTLHLSLSDFSHGFFTAFSACPNNSLETLYLGHNGLIEKIPNSFGRLGSLKYFDLTFNSLWGSIPASISNLSSLQILDLSYNDMNLTIPESFGRLSALVNLYLIGSSWEGVITEARLMNLTRLEYFVLTTYSSLVFNVTYNWVPHFKLKNLELENCIIGPKFPVWLKVQSELIHVTLENARISDTIPEEWFSKISSQLRFLDLSNNQIFGNFPHQFLFINIGFINLSYNCFKGPILFCLSNGTQLQIGFLSLKSNFFSGPIPSNISDIMPTLYYLDLSKNFFNGTILSIQKMNRLVSHQLQVVDIAYNNLSGKFPSSMGFLRSLVVLMLSNNNLYGEIPSSLQNCYFWSINLGGNHLSGNLPSWIGSQVFVLRLRSNLFNGIIPQQCLSMNHLTRNIPLNIGNLRHLETLDLSNNSLYGPILASMGSLTFLTQFNLSINNSGNPSLCGSPLPTKCLGHETSNSPTITGGSVEGKQDGDYSERLWFYLSLELGFVKSWRHSYFHFCDDVKDRMTLIIALKVVHLKRKFGLEKIEV
ncbi:hypothetical protein ACB092_01G082300 [Castanea dentata]